MSSRLDKTKVDLMQTIYKLTGDTDRTQTKKNLSIK